MIGKKINPLLKDRIKNGDKASLLSYLESLDDELIKRLKIEREDPRFYQGASRLLDHILEILV